MRLPCVIINLTYQILLNLACSKIFKNIVFLQLP